MGLPDLAEAELPPATLVEFVKRCLNIDTTTIVDVAKPSIQREIYDIGWDRYAICWELTAKEQILERYKAVTAELQALEALPDTQRPAYAAELCAARARADEAGRAFLAIATTYKDRYGYGRAVRGIQDPTASVSTGEPRWPR